MTTPASGSNETDPAPGAPLSRGVVRRGWASRCRASLFSFRLPGARVPLSSEAAGPSRQRQKWRAYTGGHSERRPSNGACTRANVRQQPRSGLSRSGLTPRGGFAQSGGPPEFCSKEAKPRASRLYEKLSLSVAGGESPLIERSSGPVPSETEVARVHRRSQRATPVKRRLHAGKRPAATS